ncbi:MAG: hypothetical protein WDO24_28180 [Pseudomonadota bacterium]
MGPHHGRGDHPLPGVQGHGGLRQLPWRDRRLGLCLLRRFDSEAQREALYKAVYESDYWKTKMSPRIPDYLDRPNNVVTRIIPTPKSTVQ